MQFRRTVAVVAIAAALLAACAKPTEVITLYEPPESLDTSYSKLLVVVLSDEPGMRRRLEELITSELAVADVVGVPAYTHTGPATTLLQDVIDMAARQSEADAILMTHVVSIHRRLDVDPETIDVDTDCRAVDPQQQHIYENKRLKKPPSVRLAHTVVAITNLYAADSGERVWTIQSTCFEKTNMEQVLQEEATAIVEALADEGLVG